ncbi:MAG: hypothetical protein FWF66_04505, partial [Candidatus Bathyarchaeota archaeon]|nr:hypothetical protein [Candidatus Termiticorpusculum sp.]
PGVTAKPGYVFKGWSPVVPYAFPGADATYTATWEVNVSAWSTVTFVNGDESKGALGGTLSFTGIKGTSSPAIVEPTATPVVGYVFAGWDVSVPSVYPDADLVLTGGWSIVKVVEVQLVSVTPSASVTKLPGNTNDLTIKVVETFSDGSTNAITKNFSIANNAKGTYTVGSYSVYVATSGNTKIDDCRIVS